MQLKAEFRDEGDILYLKVTGEYDRLKAFSIIQELKSECEKKKKTRVLIDIMELIDLTKGLERFFIGEEISKVVGRQIVIAVYGKKEDIDEYFTENVAVNRGVRLKMFLKKEDAIAWLNKK